MSLAFVEAFGPTIQGEGPQAGKASSFIRFGACNLSCSWCDSAYTWDTHRFNMREEITMLSPQEVVDRIPAAPLLVITGGEPLLQQHRKADWAEFLGLCDEKFPFLSIETNGTQLPDATSQTFIDQFVVSPKLSTVEMLRNHSRLEREPQAWGKVLAAGNEVDFKIVVTNPSDVDEAVGIAERAGIPMTRLWLMPEGTSKAELDSRWGWVSDAAAALGCNASHRLHVLAWNDERGH